MSLPGAAILVLVVTLANSMNATKAGEPEMARFLREYPAAGAKLKAYYSTMRGTCRITHVMPDGARITKRGTFARDHGFGKVTIEPDTRDSPEGDMRAVYCVGNGTAFRLYKLPGQEEYTVQGMGSEDERAAYHFSIGQFLDAPYSETGMPLVEVLKHRNFRLKSAEEVEGEGRTLLAIEYEMGDPTHPELVRVILDPDAGWILRSGERKSVVYPGPPSRFDVDYFPIEGDLPYPRLVRVDGSGQVSTCEFQEFSRNGTPREEFSMGHYGLADLTAIPLNEPSNNLLSWLVGLALAALVATILLFRLVKRLANPT